MVAQAKTAESFRKAENQSLIGNAFDKLPAEQRTMLWLQPSERMARASEARNDRPMFLVRLKATRRTTNTALIGSILAS
jgi:hypothetical protein